MRLWELDSELQAHPDVGIRTLKDLTKDELIYLLHECCTASTVNYALCDVANKRFTKQLQREREATAKHAEVLKKWKALFAPYQGCDFSQIPEKVLMEGKFLIDEMRRLEDIFLGDSIPKNKRKKR